MTVARGARSSSVLLRLDWPLLVAVLVLVAVGTLLVASATSGDVRGSGGAGSYVARQLAAATFGVVLMMAVALAGQRWVRAVAPVAYAGIVLLLATVLLVGDSVNGVRGWLPLPFGAQLQPAELAKPVVVVALAALFAAPALVAAERSPGAAAVAAGVLGAVVPIGLVLAAPDLGTAAVLAVTTAGVLLLSGVRARVLAFLALCAATATALAVSSGTLADYQVDRLRSFVDPRHDPDGVGYNAVAAREAIEAGGLWGAGLFRGPRTSGAFVPEQHTDFVFTVAGEELGFVGSAALVLVLAFVLWRAIRIARSAIDRFGCLAAGGIACWFAVQSFENIGMTMGLTPITGVPLPFVSYGGSSIIAAFLAVGVLQAVHTEAAR